MTPDTGPNSSIIRELGSRNSPAVVTDWPKP
jgi:hypothetical protein